MLEASNPAFKFSAFRVFCNFVKSAGKWIFRIEPLIRGSPLNVCKIYHSTFKGLKTAISSGCSRCVAFGIKHANRILFSKHAFMISEEKCEVKLSPITTLVLVRDAASGKKFFNT